MFLFADRYSSEEEFVDDLKNMWFGLYSRGNEEADSSGFEHVFSGGHSAWKGRVGGTKRNDFAQEQGSPDLEEWIAKLAGREGRVYYQAKREGSEKSF